MVRLYYCELPDTAPAVKEDEFSSYRLEKLRTLSVPTLRLQSIISELLLIHALRQADHSIRLPLPIMTEEQGKPYLKDSSTSFSLSHSGRFAACALSDQPIGLDIQELRKPHERMLERCFSESERLFIRTSENPAEAFTMIWCLKESYVKATGTGLSGGLRNLSINLSGPRPVTEDGRARFWTRTISGISMALCTLSGDNTDPEVIKVKLG